MRIKLQPIKTTIVGGLVFLVPLAIVIVIFGKIFHFMNQLAAPISSFIPIESIGGIVVADLATLIATLLLCFFAGLVARSAFGGKISEAVESKIYSLFPRYAFVKSMAGSVTGGQAESDLKPVLARFDDSSQVAFEVDRNQKGIATVYLPGAPDPWSGSLVHMTEDRVEPLDQDFATVIKHLRTLGKSAA